MSNVAVLKLTGQSDLSAISRDLRNIANEGKSAGPPLASLKQTIDQTAQSATTFGQKLKSFGSTFSNTISQGSTFAFTLVNLQRQYRDLGDAQIAVDRSTLKVSRSNEGLSKAQARLNQLQR